MSKQYDVRIVIALKDEFAKAVNNTGVTYCDDPKMKPLQDVLRRQKATLSNVMRDFEYYVQSSDAHGAEDSPIISWSRDATQTHRAKSYYANKFVVSFGAGQKVVSQKRADEFVADVKVLEGGEVVELVRVDTMDPSENPPIPQRYFKANPV